MRKKRELVEGAVYHVSSRTNDKIHVFNQDLGQKVMLLVLEDAKEKYGFKLHNFCIMPNHIHLLITPSNGENLSRIVQWIKTKFAKIWNGIHGSQDHLWGERFFSRAMKDLDEYIVAYNYIDQNPVKAGLANSPVEWEASGAFYIANDCSLVDR
jgi:putative transposase